MEPKFKSFDSSTLIVKSGLYNVDITSDSLSNNSELSGDLVSSLFEEVFILVSICFSSLSELKSGKNSELPCMLVSLYSVTKSYSFVIRVESRFGLSVFSYDP